jgi:hypothetical protein
VHLPLWGNHLDYALLRLALGQDLRLGIVFQRAAAAGMPHQFLNDLYVLSVGDEKRRKCVSKSMPPNLLVDPGPRCRRANDLLQQGVWPVRMFPLITRAREYPVVGLPIPASLLP